MKGHVKELDINIISTLPNIFEIYDVNKYNQISQTSPMICGSLVNNTSSVWMKVERHQKAATTGKG